MFYTISSVTSFSHIDLISVFLAIKCIFKLQWPNNQLRKSTPVKALNFQWKMSEISKPLAWLRTTMCKSVLFMFEIRTEKKKEKNFFEAPYRGHPFEEWVPLFSLSTLLTCFAICCLSVTCWLNGWLLTPTCAQTGRPGRCVLNEVYCGDCWKVNPFPDVPATVLW